MRDAERAALERLDQLGGASLIRDLIALYRDQTSERLVSAREAVQRRDAAALGAAAHAIRSSSAQLGADELRDACLLLENVADASDFSRAAEVLGRVEDGFRAFGERLARATQIPDVPVSGDRAPRQAPSNARTIAVIEDNLDNRLLIDALIGDLYALDEYENGTDALAAMRVQPPALVLLDVSLPGMDGLDVLTHMRRDVMLRHVPVVAVTAHAMAGDRERYLAAGFDGYVPKPIVDEHALLDTIERLLRVSAGRVDHDGDEP